MRAILRITSLLGLALAASAQTRLPLQDDLWREFDLYRDRLFQLAKAVPADKYNWQPTAGVRSIQQVILHAALNNYMLLDMMGERVPADVYPELPAAGGERLRAILKKNADIEKQPPGKDEVLAIYERSFAAIAGPIKNASAADLNKPAMFFDRKSTIGGLQMRAVMHLHEHLGQFIAYARSMGVVPPWSQ